MQCASAILSSVTWPAIQHFFPTLSNKRHDFRKKKVIEFEMCVLIFSTSFFWNISHSKKKWTRYDEMYIGLYVKYMLFLSDFNETSSFSMNFWNILKYKISWKSVQWEPSCSMRTDERTDMTKLIVAFGNFANSPKNVAVRVLGTVAKTRFTLLSILSTHNMRRVLRSFDYYKKRDCWPASVPSVPGSTSLYFEHISCSCFANPCDCQKSTSSPKLTYFQL